jgi:predicted mannosyl-3-phosphoglycerate phosphatase (HAD superfamily)
MSLAVELDVCGQRRIYRDIGGSNAIVWQDITETIHPTGVGLVASPRPASATAHVTSSEIRAVSSSARAEVVQCAQADGLQQVTLRIQINGNGSAIYLGAEPEPQAGVVGCFRQIVNTLRFRETGAEPITIRQPYTITNAP